MEDELSNKFPKTNELSAEFSHEKERLMNIKMMVGQYKVGLSK
jgi:hypothetical protein